jgi:P pilus assembly chaperone PapD
MLGGVNIRMKYSYLLGLLALSLAHSPQPGQAQIAVDNVLLHMKAGKRPIVNTIVRNGSKSVFYVESEARLLINPGGGSEEKAVPADDLLLSPKKFSLGPNQERAIRLLLKKVPPEMEQVYRIAFIPQSRSFEEPENKASATFAGRSTDIRIITGMGLLLFVDPLKPRVQLAWTRAGGRITFTNKGNVLAGLVDAQACLKVKEGEENCTPVVTKRVYGGRDASVEVPGDRYFKLSVENGSTSEIRDLLIPVGDGSAEIFPDWADPDSKP